MKILFVQGGSRWKIDERGNFYNDSTFSDQVWSRYREFASTLTVLLRGESEPYAVNEARQRFNYFDTSKMQARVVPDVYRPFSNFFSISKRKKIRQAIENEVKSSDFVVIRSLGNFYTDTALKVVQRFNVPYFVEVTGFAFETLWNHGLAGKIFAPIKEMDYRFRMTKVPRALYVTQSALQARYSTHGGEEVGISDVLISDPDKSSLRRRLEKISDESAGGSSFLTIGTAGTLNSKIKGQETVLKAICILKKNGVNNIRYRLVGMGSSKSLIRAVKRMGLEKEVLIEGSIAHEKIPEWLDDLDVYVQPSLSEGLSRSIIEALGRACPVICTNVGGSPELVAPDAMFRPRDAKRLEQLLRSAMSANWRAEMARRNFKKSFNYSSTFLDERREKLFAQWIRK